VGSAKVTAGIMAIATTSVTMVDMASTVDLDLTEDLPVEVDLVRELDPVIVPVAVLSQQMHATELQRRVAQHLVAAVPISPPKTERRCLAAGILLAHLAAEQ